MQEHRRWELYRFLWLLWLVCSELYGVEVAQSLHSEMLVVTLPDELCSFHLYIITFLTIIASH